MKQHPTRRTFLKATGVTLALPTMESLGRARQESKQPPTRMICIGNEFGMYPGSFWPKSFGRDYEMTPLLKPLEEHRSDFTLFANLDHGLKGGHFAIHAYLTGVKSAEARGMADGGISLDQRAIIDEPSNEGLTKDLPKVYDLLALKSIISTTTAKLLSRRATCFSDTSQRLTSL